MPALAPASAPGEGPRSPLTPEEATLEECKLVLHAFMKRIRDIEEHEVASVTAILGVFEQLYPDADIEVSV